MISTKKFGWKTFGGRKGIGGGGQKGDRRFSEGKGGGEKEEDMKGKGRRTRRKSRGGDEREVEED